MVLDDGCFIFDWEEIVFVKGQVLWYILGVTFLDGLLLFVCDSSMSSYKMEWLIYSVIASSIGLNSHGLSLELQLIYGWPAN